MIATIGEEILDRLDEVDGVLMTVVEIGEEILDRREVVEVVVLITVEVFTVVDTTDDVKLLGEGDDVGMREESIRINRKVFSSRLATRKR